MTTNIDFVFFDAGGGHRSAANALRSVIERQARPWRIRLVNLQEVLDELDVFRQLTGLRLQDLYNLILKKGWTLGSRQLLPLMHGVIRVYHRGQVRLLEQFWGRETPDMVVSLVPNFNRAMFQALQRVSPRTPYVTVLTDLADFPPHFWMERQEQHLVCGTARAVRQARAMGHSPERVFRTSGMILNPRFYEPAAMDCAEERKRLGLDPALPTGLVLFGGQGAPVMLKIHRRLERAGLGLQLIHICGRNEKLRRALERESGRLAKYVEGFTAEVPYYMRLADFFIGKPGPGSVSEAVAMGLPCIVERNAFTLPQERYNAEWLREENVGIVVRSFREIAPAVRELLAPETFACCQERARALENRAVFEIPDILARLLPAK